MLCGAGGEQQRFTAHGELSLAGAHIGGQLNLDGAELTNESGAALHLQSARVDGELFMRFADRPAGMIDLTAAHLGRVYDSDRTWPSRLRLRGCTYSSLSAVEDANTGPGRKQLAWLWWRVRPARAADVERRLRWIKVAEDGGHCASGGDGYAPQPYAQLMAYYRREGRDGDARRVGYERERRRRRQLHLPGQAWNVFLRWTVGYGYKPMRALLLLGVLVFVGTLAFSSLHDDGKFQALKDPHPRFVALIYTLDRLIPVVSFGLRDAFAPSGVAQVWAFVYTLLGWILTVAILAGLNVAVRRD